MAFRATKAASAPLGRKAPARAGAVSVRQPRVLITKIGLDGHDRGSRVVAAYLRDVGMEVIYTPPWQPIPTVIKLAIEEDVDVIGIGALATDHLLVPKLMDALRAAGGEDIPVVVGGIVPDADEQALRAAGVAAVFHPGAGREEIVGTIARLAAHLPGAEDEPGKPRPRRARRRKARR
ncbi:MAG: cobalamin-dependent protein [Rhodospirillales bacterium]|nr:cobalamin-dependent protein [Rhodospirillales bacterium]